MSNVAPLPPLDAVVWQDPARMNGALCFAGTRVLVSVLLDYVEGGYALADFLDGFPTVERWQAEAALEYAAQGALAPYGIGRVGPGRRPQATAGPR